VTRTRTIPHIVVAGFAVALAGMVTVAAGRQAPPSPPPGGSLSFALPEGEGRSLVTRACGGCHEPSLVMFTREDEEGWKVIVNDMVARGAKATSEEIKVMSGYLAAHFNRQSKFAPLKYVGAAGDEAQLFAAGKEIYGTLCVICHQADGRGRDKIAPALVGSQFVLGPPAIVVRIMLHGKRGPTNVMPALGSLMTDEQIAAVLTYVRREWGQTAPAVDAAAVSAIRSSTTGRARPWTAEELEQVAGQSGKGEASARHPRRKPSPGFSRLTHP
jgi:mono/diheme cytochrome c family protein